MTAPKPDVQSLREAQVADLVRRSNTPSGGRQERTGTCGEDAVLVGLDQQLEREMALSRVQAEVDDRRLRHEASLTLQAQERAERRDATARGLMPLTDWLAHSLVRLGPMLAGVAVAFSALAGQLSQSQAASAGVGSSALVLVATRWRRIIDKLQVAALRSKTRKAFHGELGEEA